MNGLAFILILIFAFAFVLTWLRLRNQRMINRQSRLAYNEYLQWRDGREAELRALIPYGEDL